MLQGKKGFLIFILFMFFIGGIGFYLGAQVWKNKEKIVQEKLDKKLERMQIERDSLLSEYNAELKTFNISIIKLREEVAKSNKLKRDLLEKANQKPPEDYEELEIAIYDLLNKIRN